MPDFLTAAQPEWASDRLVTHVDVGVSWADRLRVLIRGRFSMRVDCYTENTIGRTEGRSIFIAPNLWPARRGIAYAPEEGEKQ